MCWLWAEICLGKFFSQNYADWRKGLGWIAGYWFYQRESIHLNCFVLDRSEDEMTSVLPKVYDHASAPHLSIYFTNPWLKTTWWSVWFNPIHPSKPIYGQLGSSCPTNVSNVHDRYDLFKCLSDAIDKVRRREAKKHQELKHSHYAVFKNPEYLNEKQRSHDDAIEDAHYEVSKAWQVR